MKLKDIIEKKIIKEDVAMSDTNLDVDTPEKVPQILINVAEKYYESASELPGAWQDPNAGKIWGTIAKILEAAADKIKREIDKGY